MANNSKLVSPSVQKNGQATNNENNNNNNSKNNNISHSISTNAASTDNNVLFTNRMFEVMKIASNETKEVQVEVSFNHSQGEEEWKVVD